VGVGRRERDRSLVGRVGRVAGSKAEEKRGENCPAKLTHRLTASVEGEMAFSKLRMEKRDAS
jgi:hypothetical protein